MLAVVVAALLAVTLDPALRVMLSRERPFSFRPIRLASLVNAVLVGRVHAESAHPVSRLLIRAYEPAVRWSLRWKWAVIGAAFGFVLISVPVFLILGGEFMPPLDEGSLFYMPSTMPGIAIAEAQKLLEQSDRIIKTFPEVDHVLGKAGRAETATDLAPLSMFETVIVLKPTSEWRKVATWYSPVGTRVAGAAVRSAHPGSHQPRAARRRAQSARCGSRVSRMRGRCRSGRESTCSAPASGRRSA